MTDSNWYTPIIAKYPMLFKKIDYLQCDKGWSTLIDNLSDVIETYIKFSAPEDIKDKLYAVQVKQKFGGLRFYMNQETPYINGAISLAERQSSRICETCGNPGSQRNNKGWVVVMCNSCQSNFEKR